jgi:hypothetical protein
MAAARTAWWGEHMSITDLFLNNYKNTKLSSECFPVNSR